ncbi:hypothetical protein Vretifemale_12174 [Volvox reticuliferus]|uniref:Uncharacterized protein n=2 Tax=Volvox reticuliferus TaxID=1737510 RepID=A0A8J4CNC9_9CHLO|nr:hypothetical protein Vretifemale_12174 [Volvox reticuliferus]
MTIHARIVTLQTERSSHQLLQPTQAQRQTSPLQPRGGGRNGVGRSTITMSGLSGMELVRAALKQVETGERTLVDPLVRISSNGVSEGSRRASQSSVTTACSGHGSGVGGSSEAFQPGAGPIPVLDTKCNTNNRPPPTNLPCSRTTIVRTSSVAGNRSFLRSASGN